MAPETGFSNLFVFVADSLRWDHLPESIASEGAALKTLAAGTHTPVSFSSLLTSRSPGNHAVRGFGDRLNPSFETVYERFDNGSYYDYEFDPVRRQVLKDMPASRELFDLDEPFIFVERAMESHTPYNEVHHGNELEHVHDGDYTRSFPIDELRQKYMEGVRGVEEHFWSHVDRLEELGVRDDTLIVFTSDHGELLGERKNLRRRYAHGHPMSRELVQVPTVFLDTGTDAESMRMIDIMETCLQMLGKQGLGQDGVDVRDGEVESGEVVMDGYVSYRNRWNFEGDWRPENPLKLKKDVLREDMRIMLKSMTGREFFPRPGKPPEQELEGIDV